MLAKALAITNRSLTKDRDKVPMGRVYTESNLNMDWNNKLCSPKEESSPKIRL